MWEENIWDIRFKIWEKWNWFNESKDKIILFENWIKPYWSIKLINKDSTELIK